MRNPHSRTFEDVKAVQVERLMAGHPDGRYLRQTAMSLTVKERPL